MITKVTITGADDSIEPIELAKLSQEFPFVEWGILVSKNNYGTPRFPSLTWLQKLRGLKHDVKDLKLSCHLCGSFVRDLVKGNDMIIQIMGPMWYIFERVQINFHAIPHEHSNQMIGIFSKFANQQFIFQYDGVNDHIVKKAFNEGCNMSALFDKSGGAGILPAQWPQLLEGIPCGYAGGLSPDNVEEQIKIIEGIVGETEIWIDVETHVRSNMDSLFDLTKVRKFLEISSCALGAVKHELNY
jgi:hypothetical protein